MLVSLENDLAGFKYITGDRKDLDLFPGAKAGKVVLPKVIEAATGVSRRREEAPKGKPKRRR